MSYSPYRTATTEPGRASETITDQQVKDLIAETIKQVLDGQKAAASKSLIARIIDRVFTEKIIFALIILIGGGGVAVRELLQRLSG